MCLDVYTAKSALTQTQRGLPITTRRPCGVVPVGQCKAFRQFRGTAARRSRYPEFGHRQFRRARPITASPSSGAISPSTGRRFADENICGREILERRAPPTDAAAKLYTRFRRLSQNSFRSAHEHGKSNFCRSLPRIPVWWLPC